MYKFWEKILVFIVILGEGFCLQSSKIEEKSADVPKYRHRRYNDRPNYNYDYVVEQPYQPYPPYPHPNEYYPRPPGSNLLTPLGVAGGAGLAIKAIKTKSVLKMLAGLGVLGGVLAAKFLPPKVIGGINLPFQGKRKKRSLFRGLSEEQILRRILSKS